MERDSSVKPASDLSLKLGMAEVLGLPALDCAWGVITDHALCLLLMNSVIP